MIVPIFSKAACVYALKGLALPHACHFGEIALAGSRRQRGLALPRASHTGEIVQAGSRRLRSTLEAAPVLFAHAVVTEQIGEIIIPIIHVRYLQRLIL